MAYNYDVLDYFNLGGRVTEFRRWLSTQPRDINNHEFATIDQSAVSEFAESETDWLILTNRVAGDENVHVVGPSKLLHAKLNHVIREKVRAHRKLGPVSIARIAADVSTPVQMVRRVVENILEGPTKQADEGRWLGPDEVHVGAMSFNVRGGAGSHPRYPKVALERLYARSESATASGAAGIVSRHHLTRRTTYGDRGMAVAVKLISQATLAQLNDDVARGEQRLLREFCVGRSHTSPRLVKTLDVFPTILDDAARGGSLPAYGLVMEHLEGQPLSEIDDLTPWNLRVELAEGLARAVADLHALNYVHRDIKPANAIFCPDRGVVLLDFGIATSPDMPGITETRDHLFTWRYASPEQMDDSYVQDPSVDAYALGVSIFEILSGKPAWHWEPEWNHGRAKHDGPLDAPAGALKSPEFSSLIRMLTDLDPSHRPPPLEVADSLRSLRSSG